jgi:hypothetical protein
VQPVSWRINGNGEMAGEYRRGWRKLKAGGESLKEMKAKSSVSRKSADHIDTISSEESG